MGSTPEEHHREQLPEEREAGADDPVAQAEAIMKESEERAATREDSGGTVEHRRSDSTDRP